MASLLPTAVIARHLFNDPPTQYRRPAVTTRRPEGRVAPAQAPAAGAPVSRPVVPAPRPSLLSRLAQLVFHPVSTVRH
jgi:hypothetical protein